MKDLDRLSLKEKIYIVKYLIDNILQEEPDFWSDLMNFLVMKHSVSLEKQKERNSMCEKALISALSLVKRNKNNKEMFQITTNLITEYLRKYSNNTYDKFSKVLKNE